MNRMSLIALRYLCGAFILTGSIQLTAEDAAPAAEVSSTDVQSENAHAPVGVRRMSQAQHVQVQEMRAAEAKKATEQGEKLQACVAKEDSQNDVLKEALESKESRMASAGSKKASVQAGLFVTTHQGAFHNPLSVSFLGDAVTLEDGSVWSVSSDDTYKTLNWLTSDLIVVTPNHAWFSVYDYVLTNQNTGISVKTNLVLGPLLDAVYRHYIVAIDYLLDRIWLEDGSSWSMTDYSVMRQWQVYDTVIIGVNDGWFSSSYPNILINVNMLNYCRGVCTY